LETLQETLTRIERGDLSTLGAIEALLGEELTTRQSRRMKMALQTARLTSITTLAGYDFSFQPSLDHQQIGPGRARLRRAPPRGPSARAARTGKSQVSIAPRG